MLLLGIDIGTTGICGLLLDSDRMQVINTVTKPNKSFMPSTEDFEKIQDPKKILDTVNEIISEISVKPDAVGFSCQMHGIVYTDEEMNALSPLYIWQDGRGGLPYKDGKTYAEYLGCFPGYGLSTALYNRENGIEPDNAKYICTIGDYIIAKMCSLSKPLTHISNAAGIGGFDLLNNKFHVDFNLLPDVTDKFEFAGKTSDGIPVCVCIGDNQAGFIGSVPDSNGILVNIGTGAQVSYLVDNINPLSEAEQRPFDGKRYLMAGCSLCGGRAFAMFEKFCREIVNLTENKIDSFYPYLDKLLSDITDTDLSADCRFCGTRKNSEIRGGFFGLSENNFRPEDFALAVLDGMVRELYDMYDVKDEIRPVYVSGNGIRKNPVLLKIIEKYFGITPKSTVFEEEAAFGAALCAGTAAGTFESIYAAGEKIITQ